MMSFIILGLIVLVFGVFFMRRSIKTNDKEGIIGFTAILIAAIVLLIFFGLFFRALL
ncbi:hypothetical protein HYV69_00790 [Candidatus Uhrbacteria bacterium]|nr:hypothetical protein [Candidatus Uhrbacteria bacterium]